MPKTSVLVGSILLVVCGFLAAAQPAPNQSARSLLVNVLDRNGNPVRDLTKDSFRVKVNGHPAAIEKATYSLAPRKIVLLLDTSGSMMEIENKWEIAREAVADLLKETPSEEPIALLTFSNRVNDVINFSQGRARIADWLKQGPSQGSDLRGKTAFFDAVAEATKLLQPGHPGDSLYAITDGDENDSSTSDAGARKRLLRSGIRLFVFLLDEEPSLFGNQSGAAAVMETARATGGFVFGLPSRRDVHTRRLVYDGDERTLGKVRSYTLAVNIRVNGFYALDLDTLLKPGKTGEVSLDVVDEKGKSRKDLALAYPKTLQSQPN